MMARFILIKISLKLLFLLSALNLAAISSIHADNEIDSIRIVRGIGNYPPLEMNEKGRLTGLHIDMIRQVAKNLDVEVEFVSLPWGRAVKYFSEGKFDAISYYGYTEKRAKFSYYFSGNILTKTRWVLIALEERKQEFVFNRKLQGLEEYIVGVQLSYSHGAYFDSMKHFQRDAVIDEFALERMLKNRRHDLAMMSYQEFLGFKQRGDFNGIVALSPSIDVDPQYLAFAKTLDEDLQRKKLAKRFAKEFERFKLTREYARLLEKYDFSQYDYKTQ